jgi:hypothetical protein
VTLQCPLKGNLLPQGASAGRRERESRREGRREQSLRGHSANPSRVVTVESILVVWKAQLFAGRCRNEGLGRSVDCVGFPPYTRRADDSECSEDAEEGNVRQHAPVKAQALEASTCCMHYEDASFTRSFGPCSSILTMHSGVTRSGGAGAGASRLGKPTQVGGTSTGAQANGRSAARRVSLLSQGSGVARLEKEGGRGRRPYEDTKSFGFGCPHVEVQLQKSIGDVLVPNKLGKRAPKSAVRVE